MVLAETLQAYQFSEPYNIHHLYVPTISYKKLSTVSNESMFITPMAAQ